MSLYTDIVAAGVPYDHHESDLYIPMTDQTNELVAYHLERGLAKPTLFRNNKDHTQWIDIPFAYDPYWKSRAKREMRIPNNNT